jgi:hypothetical protein
MKHSVITQYFIVLILLLVVVVPVAATSITSISPSVGYLGTTPSVTITGTGFNASEGKVKLMMDDESNITGSLTSWSDTSIVCKFTISSSKTTGDWDLIVINDQDGTYATKTFAIKNAMSVTSISPVSGRTNNDSVDFTVKGTGLSDVEYVYLYNSDYDNITASASDTSSTSVTGTFDLTDATEETYKVCTMDSSNTRKCFSSVTFDITSDAVGSMDVSSSPSGASLYVDGSLVGTTPYTVEDLDEGSHKVVIQKSGYVEWGKMVKITSGGTTTVDADLAEITTEATQAPAATPIPTVPTAVKTTMKASTIKVPTTWPSTVATTQASPVGLLAILGAVGFAFIVLKKK